MIKFDSKEFIAAELEAKDRLRGEVIAEEKYAPKLRRMFDIQDNAPGSELKSEERINVEAARNQD
jgi:hypothetical protein